MNSTDGNRTEIVTHNGQQDCSIPLRSRCFDTVAEDMTTRADQPSPCASTCHSITSGTDGSIASLVPNCSVDEPAEGQPLPTRRREKRKRQVDSNQCTPKLCAVIAVVMLGVGLVLILRTHASSMRRGNENVIVLEVTGGVLIFLAVVLTCMLLAMMYHRRATGSHGRTRRSIYAVAEGDPENQKIRNRHQLSGHCGLDREGPPDYCDVSPALHSRSTSVPARSGLGESGAPLCQGGVRQHQLQELFTDPPPNPQTTPYSQPPGYDDVQPPEN